MKDIRLSIVIPVYNNYNFTKKCLEDLSELPDDHEIIVLDNGSTDSTRKLESTDRLRVYHCNKNHGFSKGVNIAYTMTSGKNVMFLNNDIRVRSNKSDWTSKIIEVAESGRRLVGPTVGVLDQGLNFVTEANKIPSSGYVYMSGWNITASVDTWKELILDEYEGPFTQEFGTYFEDTDLSFRAKELGIGLNIVECPVHHFGKMTSKKIGTMSLYAPAKAKFIQKWRERIDAIR